MKTCSSCQKPKGNLTCELCSEAICKVCAQFTDEETFSFLEPLPEILKHHTFCPHCYDDKIAPEVANYNDLMERAKNIVVFYKTQAKENVYIRRTQETVRIKDCPDKAEALLRLAFQAVQGDFNCLVDVEIYSEKILDKRYQKAVWHGYGKPVRTDLAKIKRIERTTED